MHGLGHVDAALARDDRRVDHVHAVHQRRQQPGERRGAQRLDVELGDVAFVLDRDARITPPRLR